MPGEDEAVVPGLTLEPTLEQKLAGLDEHLEPLKKEEQADEPAEPEEKPKEDGEKEDEASGDAEKPDESKEAGKSDDDGYTIDEGEEEKPEPDSSVETKAESDTASLTSEQRYILDNLKPITVHGTVGDDKVQAFKVYDPSQLPLGFKFTDDRELAAANKAFALVENQAEKLQNDYRNQESAKASKEFEKREKTADQQDIGDLQRSGDIPKFKVAPNSKEFDADPAAVLIQEVLDYKDSQNKKYYDEYQSGRPYKHIGFTEAFYMFRRSNPTKANVEQQKEDQERTNIAKRTARSKGTPDVKQQKARVHSGSTSRDLDLLIDNLDW